VVDDLYHGDGVFIFQGKMIGLFALVVVVCDGIVGVSNAIEARQTRGKPKGTIVFKTSR